MTFELPQTLYRQEAGQVGTDSPLAQNAARLYEKYSDMLFRIAVMHSESSEDAADAVQDVFLSFMHGNIRFNSDEHEKSWFIRAVINRSRDIRRKNKYRWHEELSAAESVAAKDYFSDEHNLVLEAMEKLPDKLKSVLVLHCLEGLSIEQTAGILKLTQSAVKMRLSRGRDSLREILKTEGFNV